jgi:hypothetical protein
VAPEFESAYPGRTHLINYLTKQEILAVPAILRVGRGKPTTHHPPNAATKLILPLASFCFHYNPSDRTNHTPHDSTKIKCHGDQYGFLDADFGTLSQLRSAFSVTDPTSWAEHIPIPEYRHAGNFPCRSNVARGSPRRFTDKLLTSRRLTSRRQSARNDCWPPR